MSPVIAAEGITKRFSGIVALDGVDLHVDEGERVGLIGPNGAGKTTFFNCLLGVLRADEGTVELDGRDVSDLPVHQRARLGIGRTFQRIELFPDTTVREHLLIAERTKRRTGRLWKDLVGLGRPRPDEIAQCDEVLELLGLGALADEPIERLSLGQGRLVEVGRALMTDPKLLLLDEPSSGLDRSETAALAETLGEVQAERGFAILLVEHDVELVASFTTRCYLLDFGRLIAEGPTATLMASKEMRQAYLGDLDPPADAGDGDDGGGAADAGSDADADGDGGDAESADAGDAESADGDGGDATPDADADGDGDVDTDGAAADAHAAGTETPDPAQAPNAGPPDAQAPAAGEEASP